MIQSKDKIFKNLYGESDWTLKGAQSRGIWIDTHEIIKTGIVYCQIISLLCIIISN